MMDIKTAFPLDFSPVKKTTEFTLSSRPSLSYWQDAWIRLKKNKQALASLFIVVGLVVFTLIGPYVWRVDPSNQELSRISEAPSLGRSVLVLPEEVAYEEVVVAGHEESPTADGASLDATAEIQIMGVPSIQGVRFKWTPVKGAAGYSIYRTQTEPKDRESLGVPLSSIEGGNRVSFDDGFDLQAGRYFYAVVAKNGEESSKFKVISVDLKAGISLSDAQSISPDAKIGEMLKMGARPLGTDYLGRDMLARLIFGARVSLFIGFFAPLLYVILGILIGGISGYFGGKIDDWLMRITDFVLALPFLLFMILFKIAFGAGPGDDGIFPMLIALIVLSWTGAARLTRGQILQLRESEFVQASRLLGAKSLYLIFRHLLPNTLGVILVYLTFAVPSAIFTEAFLSFIGMGVAPPTPSWGSMCNDGIKSFLIHPHEFIFPALFISITVLAFNLLGDGLRDALDPKMRSQS
ncbi:MAG: ABC transporter permease [Bdellovibrionales bacterium]|nr:ABC transporter permease [Bdellovibrionales bacterium]